MTCSENTAALLASYIAQGKHCGISLVVRFYQAFIVDKCLPIVTFVLKLKYFSVEKFSTLNKPQITFLRSFEILESRKMCDLIMCKTYLYIICYSYVKTGKIDNRMIPSRFS